MALNMCEGTHYRIDGSSGCWLWIRSTFRNGYGQVTREGNNWRAHRLAWTLWRGQIPDGLCVLHKCDTPSCINPEHLFLGTHQDNNDDMRAKGRARPPLGAGHGSAKLSDSDIRDIRRRYSAGTSNTVLAAEYGVCYQHIWKIAKGDAWGHLLNEDEALMSGQRTGRRCLITADQAREIRRLSSLGLSHAVIARDTGLRAKHIGKIVRRELWKDA